MKAVWNGVVIAESADTVVVEGNHYFPPEALKRELTTFSNHRTGCVWKGQAHYLLSSTPKPCFFRFFCAMP